MKPSRETIRITDQAVVDWLSALHVDYGLNAFPNRDLRDAPIFRVFATPERAFAEMRYLLIHQGFITPNTDDTEDHTVSDDELYKQIPFPFCRIQRNDIAPVNELHSTPNEFVTASQGLTYTKSRWPTPYEISYSIEFVSKTRYTDNYITEWMLGQFTPRGMGVNQRLIDAVYPEPYETKKLTVSFTGTSDASELEVQGPTDRRIRTTFNITIRTWDVDLVGRSVKAVMGVTTDYRSLVDADLSVGDQGTLIEQVANKPRRIYYNKPVPESHSCEHTTASKSVKYANHAQSYILDTDLVSVETAGIPFLSTDVAQAAVRVKWRRLDGVKPAGSIRAQILWRDSQNDFAPTVLREVTLPYSDAGAVLDYQSFPGSEFNELSVRFLRPVGGPTLVVALAEQVVYRVSMANLLSSPDRTRGPGMGAITDITLTGLARAESHFVRCFVQYGSQPVTVSVYTDMGATELVSTRTFSASGEFAAVLAPTNSQLFFLRITTPTPDATLQVTGITIMRCLPTPLLMP